MQKSNSSGLASVTAKKQIIAAETKKIQLTCRTKLAVSRRISRLEFPDNQKETDGVTDQTITRENTESIKENFLTNDKDIGVIERSELINSRLGLVPT